ncbi:hypothetical protein [Robertkochia flava]|uniref:hypothetical protein n=1 Tax=Robertkochia flava TaxID=3447986 RepID=UPI001CCCA792|nr:hypothetical protein [Robertkochia marina]
MNDACSMKGLLEYLKYISRSTNAHGVHSPFVYDLVTRGLYLKEEKQEHPVIGHIPQIKTLPEKYVKAINNTLHHFFGSRKPQLILLPCSDHQPIENPGMVFVNGLDPHRTAVDELLKYLDNDTLLMVVKAGSDPFWEALSKSHELHLTIDCFRVGFAFKRKEQAKENFTIRL